MDEAGLSCRRRHPRPNGKDRRWRREGEKRQAAGEPGRSHGILSTTVPPETGSARVRQLVGQLRKMGPTPGKWSGQRDLNPRLPAPKAGALPDCAMPRHDRELENITRCSAGSRHTLCGSCACVRMFRQSESGGIGRRARFRIWWGYSPWGFESPLSHFSLRLSSMVIDRDQGNRRTCPRCGDGA